MWYGNFRNSLDGPIFYSDTLNGDRFMALILNDTIITDIDRQYNNRLFIGSLTFVCIRLTFIGSSRFSSDLPADLRPIEKAVLDVTSDKLECAYTNAVKRM